jgi:hypothetical protein
MRPGAKEVQGNGDELCTRNRRMAARRDDLPRLVRKVMQKGRKLRPSGSFIGGDRGGWQRAHTSASMADIEAVRWQQRRLVGHTRPLSRGH